VKIEFFSARNGRSARLLKSSSAIAFFQLVNILVNFLTVTIALDCLGVEEYGVWVTLTSIVTWFGFLDIGLAHGLRNLYAEAKARGDEQKINDLVSTSFFAMAAISTLGFICLAFLGQLFDWARLLNAPEYLGDNLKIVAIFLMATFCLKLVLNIVNVLNTADQRPEVNAGIVTFCNLFAFIGILVISKVGSSDFFVFGTIFTIGQLIPSVVAFFFFFATRYRLIIPSLKFFSFATFKSIFGIGVKFFVIQFSNLLLLQSNLMVIAHFFGPSAVSEYSIAHRYLWVIMVIHSAMVSPLWSASTEAFIKKDIDWLRNTVRGLNSLVYGLLFLGIIMIAVAPEVYRIWLNQKIQVDFVLSGQILLFFVLTMRYSNYRMFLNGIGKIQLQFYITLLQATLHLPLVFLASSFLGLYGLLSVFLLWPFVNSIWESIQYKRIVTGTASGIWNK
jgi:O-antigen/teichoic acid export membrane protein